MGRKNNNFFSKSSFGFFVNGRPEKKKLKRVTLELASGLCDFINYRNKLKQKTYLGTLVTFCELVSRDDVIKATEDLIKNGLLIKKPDDTIHITQEYANFKDTIEYIEIEKQYSTHGEYLDESYFVDFFEEIESDRSFDKVLEFLDYQIKKQNEPYYNFFDGFYRQYIKFLLDSNYSARSINEEGFDYLIKRYFTDSEDKKAQALIKKAEFIYSAHLNKLIRERRLHG